MELSFLILLAKCLYRIWCSWMVYNISWTKHLSCKIFTLPTSCTISDRSSSSCKISLHWNSETNNDSTFIITILYLIFRNININLFVDKEKFTVSFDTYIFWNFIPYRINFGISLPFDLLPLFWEQWTLGNFYHRTLPMYVCSCCSWWASLWQGNVYAELTSSPVPKTPVQYSRSQRWQGQRNLHQGETHCNRLYIKLYFKVQSIDQLELIIG